jgi:phospho-N-acetylmuramoyl-pentapeptide-transferase
MLLMLATTIWLGFIGFMDDYIKLKINKDGLRPIYKLASQALLGLIVGLTLWLSPDAVIRENVTISRNETTETVVYKSEPVKSTITTIPFVKNNNLSYSNLFSFLGKYRTAAGWIFFVFVVTFVVMAVSNGSNLNDGMDGMCAGNSAIMGIALAILAYVSSHINLAAYLNIMFIPGSEELVIFLLAFVGALIGFLWYNAYPAQIFMGDTGSLAIGGIIAVTAIIIHKELLIPIICFVFLMESISVLLQTNVAKMGNKRGKKWRVFKRAPIHDTFRIKPGQLSPDLKILLNWPKGCWLESKITTRFWIITILMATLAIVTLKIR